jgi:hypothetical protein
LLKATSAGKQVCVTFHFENPPNQFNIMYWLWVCTYENKITKSVCLQAHNFATVSTELSADAPVLVVWRPATHAALGTVTTTVVSVRLVNTQGTSTRSSEGFTRSTHSLLLWQCKERPSIKPLSAPSACRYPKYSLFLRLSNRNSVRIYTSSVCMLPASPISRSFINQVSKVKQSHYTPWRRLGGRGGIAPTHSSPRH